MRLGIFLLILSLATVLFGALPIRLDDSINLIPPATNVDGTSVVFGAGSPPGAASKGTNLFWFRQTGSADSLRQLTSYKDATNYTGVTSVALEGSTAGYTALPTGVAGTEEVHAVDLGTLADRTLAVDKEGCIQPLCVNCFRACLGPVHVSPDRSRIVYAAARQRPFYVVNTDGSGGSRLPVYQGGLAASAQRVVSQSGLLVFTSSAPSGPTFAAAATEVYTINLDGTGLKQVTKFGDYRFYSSDAVISADGTWIAFVSNYSTTGPDGARIWAIRSDGTGLTQLSSGPDSASNPSISADGKTVTYLQSGQILRARIGDTTLLSLTKLSISTAFDAVLTGDGTKVLFTLSPQTSSASAVYRIQSDATTELRDFYPVYIPAYVNPAGVVGAANYAAPSPGSLITVYGGNFGRDEFAAAETFPLPDKLNGVTLLVNGRPIPLTAVTPWQINAQLPPSVPEGKATFQVLRAGSASSDPVDAEVKSIAPWAFSYNYSQPYSVYTQAAAFHAGTAIPADRDHPAAAGETLEVYAVGLGPTDPVVDAGMPAPSSPPARARQTPHVQIGGHDAAVTFAGLAPGFAGLYQVNIAVPAGLIPGLQSITWKDSSANLINAWIAVK